MTYLTLPQPHQSGSHQLSITKNWEVLLRMDSLETTDRRRDIEGIAYWLLSF